MPEISVIIGVYNANRNKIIDLSVRSIIDQTYTDWELIICDDASTDGTLEALKRYAQKDKRIKVIHNAKNHGLAYSLNRCLKLSRGDYIARMDIDDFSIPGRLAIQKSALEHRRDCAFCTCNALLFDQNGVWGKRIMQEYVEKRGYRGFNIQKELYCIREDKECYARRKYRERWFEAYIRWKGFWSLGLMPVGILYVIKPLIVGLIPQNVLRKLRGNTVMRR